MGDDELIAAIASGDGDDTALRELFSRHAPWLAARLRKALPPAETLTCAAMAADTVAYLEAGWTGQLPPDLVVHVSRTD